MMKKLFKLLIMLLITTFFVNCIPTTRAQAYSWYCKRAEGNKQPPLPSEFSFINGHNVLWMNTSRKDEGKKPSSFLISYLLQGNTSPRCPRWKAQM